MKLTLHILTGLVAFGVSLPAGQLPKQTPSIPPTRVNRPQATGADSGWHIGCDKTNRCSYYQKRAAATVAAALVSPNSTFFTQPESLSCVDNSTQCKVCEKFFDCILPMLVILISSQLKGARPRVRQLSATEVQGVHDSRYHVCQPISHEQCHHYSFLEQNIDRITWYHSLTVASRW